MAFNAGEFQLAEGDIKEATTWFLVYYQAAGLLEYYQDEDPGANREARIARHALSGGAGESRHDTLWAIKLAFRWPRPGAAGEDGELHSLLEEKAREVHLRSNPGPQEAGQRDRWTKQ